VVSTPQQGEIWWAQAEDKRRPVLIVTRNEAVAVLRRLLVAPVTRTVRGIPTEIELGTDEGLAVPCAASFDNLQPVNRALLTDRVGALAAFRQREVCRALAAMADC
jgi:mRNA interferase MazF